MKDKNAWIWGLHSVLACAETRPELVIEVHVEKARLGQPELSRGLARIEAELGFKAKSSEELPRTLRDRRHQGIAALIHSFPTSRFAKEKKWLVDAFAKPSQWAYLDRVQDPHNYGAILRSAAAFGLSGVFVGRRDQSPLSGTVAQVSAGNLFRIPIFEVGSPLELFQLFRKAAGEIIALDADGAALSQSVRGLADRPLLWVLGSEGPGVCKKILENSTLKLKIPMVDGVESLNVSNAAAVAFYEGQKFFKLH